jgi:hypothetical protein
MSFNTAVFLIAVLDLGVVLAVAAIMLVPFTLDRPQDEAEVRALADPLPLDLAA